MGKLLYVFLKKMSGVMQASSRQLWTVLLKRYSWSTHKREKIVGTRYWGKEGTMMSINKKRKLMGLPPHKHLYKSNGVLHTVDQYGLIKLYTFECKLCGDVVALEREWFRKVLLIPIG